MLTNQKKQTHMKYQNYEDDFQENDKKPQTNNAHIQTQTKQKAKTKKTQEENYEEDFNQQQSNGNHKYIDLNNSHSKQNQQASFDHKPQTLEEQKNKKIVFDINNPNREKMIEQNIKLKTQIYELAKQMDEIIAREKKPKKYGLHADEEEEDQILKSKKVQLKKQQQEIMNLKNKIFVAKRQLQYVYDSRGIQGKEDELKSLQKEFQTLQNQKQALVKVKKEQTKALKLIRNDHQYEDKIKSLKENISKVKEQCRVLSQTLVENQRLLRKNHQIYLTKQARIKEMQQKIKQSKQKQKSKAKAKRQQSSSKVQLSQQNVTPDMIAQLDTQIADLQKQRKQSQKTWNDKIHAIEAELQQKRLQEEKKLLILKDKQKQLRLNQLRIKQLKKLITHHQSQINQKKKAATSSEKQPDMKQFRYKRNIKQLQKRQ